jgi:hypothetical protein
LFWIGLLSPSDSGVQRKSDSYLDSDSGVKNKSDSHLDSNSGVQRQIGLSLGLGLWSPRPVELWFGLGLLVCSGLGFCGGGTATSQPALGSAKGNLPHRKGAGEVNGLPPPPPPLAANYSDAMRLGHAVVIMRSAQPPAPSYPASPCGDSLSVVM